VDNKNLFGNLIRHARGELSLRDFAKKCGISHTHLDSIEKGYDPRTGKPVSISFDTLNKLSAGTGIPLIDLSQSLMDQAMGKEFDSAVAIRDELYRLIGKWTPYQAHKRTPILKALEGLTEEELLEVLDYIIKIHARSSTEGGDGE
jgi:transcriptional regulator with XRE-family HTH domain